MRDKYIDSGVTTEGDSFKVRSAVSRRRAARQVQHFAVLQHHLTSMSLSRRRIPPKAHKKPRDITPETEECIELVRQAFKMQEYSKARK